MTTTRPGGKEWEQWMHGMGRYTRRLREFVGLSQEQLARVAGVSQGAVSRLEMGRAINAPLVVVLKINRAMRDALGRLDPKLLSREAREVMAIPARGIPGTEAGFDRLSVGVDPELTEIVRMYRRVHPRNRERLLILLRAAVRVLASDGAEDAKPPRAKHRRRGA